ncbi:RNA polymerase sigma factor [Roseibium album]|uniref:Sigma-W factor n=1 Tax=Roseibium album TaxID=311410 RepID=A0A0M6ZB85_9HYPH|nr:RNA polymerase sigma factor [Roseibium album]CTQ59687.1 Sigma-W factor [Roseibium album]CTQ76000.1 Sigma-W factor [Roseibium album]CTQ76562.1 Sigma-W factor [Roseibium album]
MPDSLIDQAKQGDSGAFSRLVEAEFPKLRRITRRLVGHPEDSEDILQEALAKAWSNMSNFEGRCSFATWVTSIVTRTAIDHLRRQKRWRTEAQVAYANSCAHSDELSNEVVGAITDPEFAYEVREHISYCFTCVGRSLPVDEQAALVLRDVMDLSAREASTVLGISDAVLRHRLSAARRAMEDKYDGLCALVSKQGICHQCAGLKMASGESADPADFPDVSALAARMAIVRKAEPGSMAGLHAVFWRRTKDIEEAGKGSTEPLSGCGEKEDAPET